jgi:hypothetical protein
VDRRLAIPTVALAIALAGPARAQEAAPTLEQDPRVAKFRDVERGFFVGFEAGYLSFFSTPVAEPARHPYAGKEGGASSGFALGASIGYDLTDRIGVSIFALGANEKASVDYGAFSLYAVGLDARFAFWTMKDRNGWERIFAYAHARGGYARTFPRGLFGDVETLAGGGVGVEYYARLRHFSVGASLDLVRALKAGATGWSLTPTVRYTF